MTSKSASCNYTPSAFMGLSRGVCLVTLGAATPPCNIPEFSFEGEDLVTLQCCKIAIPPTTHCLTHSLSLSHYLLASCSCARPPCCKILSRQLLSLLPLRHCSLRAMSTASSAQFTCLDPVPSDIDISQATGECSAVGCSGVQ
jgi:hypothetical protein